MAIDLSAVATKLLGNLASNADGYIKLVKETDGETDPITGDYTAGTTEIFDLVGAVTTVSDSMVDGTRIQSGDVIVTIDNQIEPELSDKLYIDDVKYQMISPIKTVNHAGTIQIYKIQARV